MVLPPASMFPEWEPNMVSITLAGAYNSGIRNFDVETAYQAALKNELGWEGRIEGAGKMDVKQFCRERVCAL